MEMIEVKTSELIGDALDRAVEIALGGVRVGHRLELPCGYWCLGLWRPSIDWGRGGPLIDKFRFCFDNAGEHGFSVVKDWHCGEPIAFYPTGKTHLIAACRAIVAAKLGDTVSVPKELMQ